MNTLYYKSIYSVLLWVQSLVAKLIEEAPAPMPTEAPNEDAHRADSLLRDSALVESQLDVAIPRWKVPPNPTAGEVHRREHGAPWRQAADEQIQAANGKAKIKQAEKRRRGLAKQVQDGLMHNFGINYGVAELAALLKEGLSLRAQSKEELSSTDVAYVQLLVAAEKYELKQLAVLLDKFPKGRVDSSGQKKKQNDPK